MLCPVCHQCTDCRTALVEFIGVVNLPLASGGVLVLDDVVYVPSLRRNLISVSKLDSSGFGFHFGNRKGHFYVTNIYFGQYCYPNINLRGVI